MVLAGETRQVCVSRSLSQGSFGLPSRSDKSHRLASIRISSASISSKTYSMQCARLRGAPFATGNSFHNIGK